MGVSIFPEYLETEARKAADIPAYENTFRRLHLNQWTEQSDRWLSVPKWDACGSDEVTWANMAGKEIYLGIDLSSTVDLTALCYYVPEHHWMFFVFFCRGD